MVNPIEIHSKSYKEYSEKYLDHALEQYKIYLEMTDRISSRRQSANTFFVGLNTVLITLAGYAKAATTTDWFFYVVTSVSGAFICYIWYRLVNSYKNLNTAKFNVVHQMEAELPFKPYDAEWDAVGRGNDKSLYQPFTELELRVPWVFGLIHVLIILYLIPWQELITGLFQ